MKYGLQKYEFVDYKNMNSSRKREHTKKSMEYGLQKYEFLKKEKTQKNWFKKKNEAGKNKKMKVEV
jgi:hypothetical protein